jgi:hypothetical protein
LLVAAVALLVAVQVVRTSAVNAFAENRPDLAARIWRDHPEVELSGGMIAIANAARGRRPVDAAVFHQIEDAALRAPLAAEPYLVRGVQAQIAGNERLAVEAFDSARWRDGRSLPARYFLADYYVRQGDARRGLGEIAALARLAPNGVMSVAPYVATYAKDRSNWPRLRKLFRSEPSIEDRALTALTTDPANADTILALSTPERRGPDSMWLSALLGTLTQAGQYEKARAVWAAISHPRTQSRSLLYDPLLTEPEAPPPFNWTLTSSSVGLAERARGGGLHVMFYGQEDGVLAKQLLTLPSGRYRLAAPIAGPPTHAEALLWTLVCDATNAPIATTSLLGASGAWTFDVPGTCKGQRLELSGRSSDLPQRAEATIRRVDLTPERPNGR